MVHVGVSMRKVSLWCMWVCQRGKLVVHVGVSRREVSLWCMCVCYKMLCLCVECRSMCTCTSWAWVGVASVCTMR